CVSREIELCTGIACCPPKVLFNGMCLEPSQVPPDTPNEPDTPTKPKADTPKPEEPKPGSTKVTFPSLDIVSTWGGSINVIEQGKTVGTKPTPTTPVLPSCIRQEGNEYKYCPPVTCSIPGTN